MLDRLTLALVVVLVLAILAACQLAWSQGQRTLREHQDLQEALRYKQFHDAVYGAAEVKPPVPQHPTDSKKYKIWENYKP